MRPKNNKKGALAIGQILLLVIGTIAIGYAFGGQVGFVSGQVHDHGSHGKTTSDKKIFVETSVKASFVPSSGFCPITPTAESQ